MSSYVIERNIFAAVCRQAGEGWSVKDADHVEGNSSERLQPTQTRRTTRARRSRVSNLLSLIAMIGVSMLFLILFAPPMFAQQRTRPVLLSVSPAAGVFDPNERLPEEKTCTLTPVNASGCIGAVSELCLGKVEVHEYRTSTDAILAMQMLPDGVQLRAMLLVTGDQYRPFAVVTPSWTLALYCPEYQ